MVPDCTLTTACFDLTKYNPKSAKISILMENMKQLLETPCYLVIYTDLICLEHIKNIRNNNRLEHLTFYILQKVEELDTFKYRENVIKNRTIYHPTKDEKNTPESHLVCCSKFELVLITIQLNPFNTKKFGWIDANVGVNFSKICTGYKNNLLLNVLDKCSEDKFHLQILNVNDKKYTNETNLKEYYSSYKFVVSGCLFITGKEIGLKILENLNNIFIKHTLMGYGHGEEMFYLEILDKYYDNIKRSYGGYNHILNNFINITVGVDYIKHIANKYMNMGYYKECIDCCDKVISQFENYNIEINYSFYFDFLFYKYVSMYYYDRNNIKMFFNHIKKLINEIPLLENEYNKNKSFYDEQFKYAM